ncbi:GntR family transcriptional regulator [Nakamurella deserti]|uniref:GntR family transcriptional regulator n=1 Tax=Nakamurella deserti TaxID=2164074 RepID=UPI000DBE352D|nr:GntR family transcriptional regulator [Nakamurella deserti]
MRLPKYFRVKNEILSLIAGLGPGTAVPTERELAERFSTSRTTVRQALTELVIDGRLERTQGRGTFIAQPRLMQVRQLTSFSQDTSDEGRRPGSVVLSIDVRPADTALATHLGVAPGAAVHRVERIRTVADEPIAHEVAHLPGPLPDLAAELALRGSLYRTLREAYGIDLAAVEDLVETTLADPVQAARLEVDPGLPLLLVHRTGWDDAGRVVEWTESVFRGDRFRFVARSRPDRASAGTATSTPG